MIRHEDERGSMTGFVAIVAIALVMVAGMAYDGGQVIKAHGAARNYAHQAARAGAQEIDLGHLRSTGEPRLDPSAAESAALNYLRRVGVEGRVSVSEASITVTVTTVQPMHILPGPDRVITVTESAAAIDEVQP